MVEAEKMVVEHAEISLKWDESWNCGEHKIDSQHKELFLFVSQLANNTYTKQRHEEIINNIDNIIKHVADHFEYEEKALMNAGYEDFKNHKMIHTHLLYRVEEVKGAVSCGEIDRIRAFAFIFDEIIVDHLLTEDTKFFHCFNESAP